MCRTDLGGEKCVPAGIRGIRKALDGFCRERFRVNVPFVVPVARTLRMCGVLMEPASVVAKAWDQIERCSNC
jgi:hypothetical protein